MASDRSWVGRNRYNEAKYLTKEYKSGVDNFIKFAIYNLQEEDNGLIRCPCKECKNKYYKNPSAVKVDLYRHGIMQWYTRWDCHGEKDMSRDEVGTSSVNTNYRDDDMYDAYDDDFEEEPNATAKEFYKMDYYAYPKNCLPENGDKVVRAYLKRNFRSYLNKEKERLENHVNNLLECGYGEEDIDIKLMNPHYFSQRTWNAICDH
ncbi:hypothetical protein POM88_047623 [Heracleum sosnowskyi]|uniref:Transposase-associated domain-containing protein n=1 Tax=Heracleum sosnowskyi TaxID=360622 RepID=A0AAD8GSI8_9APIA|nr:hypothetical protein POM88_047623 [Heracleum sosnowskyi]